jgi:hypothetical protein
MTPKAIRCLSFVGLYAFLSIFSARTKQQVSYLITARMAAKIFLASARFRNLRPRRSSSPVAATVPIRPWFLRGLENESELLGWRPQKPQSPFLPFHLNTHAPVLIDQPQKLGQLDRVSGLRSPRQDDEMATAVFGGTILPTTVGRKPRRRL